MHILYIGDNNPASTSWHRATALMRLGHQVNVLNPNGACSRQLNNSFLGKVHFRTGYQFIQRRMKKWVANNLNGIGKTDLIWVNGGELLGRDCLALLKTVGVPVILYNNDDPTGGRDGNRFNTLLKTLYLYDLCVVMREINVKEYKAFGVNNVYRTYMSYDEVVHAPFACPEDIPPEFRSEVAFIGTWMRHEKRDEFLLKLIDAGIPVNIWGSRWEKSPHWKKLRLHYKGKSLTGKKYVAAIQGAKISLGLLSKGNRDLHTTRSLEIPYAGGLLCAERTSEHLLMYNEGEDALFWSNEHECIAVCKELLENDDKREKIRIAGIECIRKNKMGNEDVCKAILMEVDNLKLFQKSNL